MKKLLVMVMSVMLILSLNSTFVFASDEKIDNVDELKRQISESMKDGNLSASEKEYLKANTDDKILALLVSEKLDDAVDILNNKETTVMEEKADGTLYSEETYDLGDGCSLIVELSDVSENSNSLVSPLATSGSSEMWKEYGNRYFTAKATVDLKISSVTLILENHYELSANGIDENYGSAEYLRTNSKARVTKKTPVIGDQIARTPGASDVNIYCVYTITPADSSSKEYKLNTTVKYLAIDKTNKKIKVGHSWTLTKI